MIHGRDARATFLKLNHFPREEAAGMKRKRTITVVVETEREVIISHGPSREAWCASCNAQVPLVTIAEAARYAGFSELSFYEQLELRAVHFHETADGRAFICLNSLKEQQGLLAPLGARCL